MDTLMQPPIIDKVFKFLSILDVDRCQHVCRVWQEVASSILKKSPPFDYFHSVLKRQRWVPEAGDEDGERQLEEIIAENHRMNMEVITDDLSPPWPSVFYWYMWRGPFSDLLPMSKVDQNIQGFLTSDAKCVARFSILLYLERLESKFMNRVIFNHPTVIIRTNSRFVFNGPVIREMDSKIKPLEIAYKEKFPGLTCQQDLISFNSYFEGLHINRYIPGVKIIVTDWSDSESARPDMNDPKFPVKSLLYFFSPSKYYYLDMMKEIEKLLQKSISKSISSGGNIAPFPGFTCSDKDNVTDGLFEQYLNNLYSAKFSYVDHKGGEPKRSPFITVAFAGERVKSAALDIVYVLDIEEQLEEFKRTLDFPTDDGRVVGFILERAYPGYYGKPDAVWP